MSKRYSQSTKITKTKKLKTPQFAGKLLADGAGGDDVLLEPEHVMGDLDVQTAATHYFSSLPSTFAHLSPPSLSPTYHPSSYAHSSESDTQAVVSGSKTQAVVFESKTQAVVFESKTQAVVSESDTQAVVSGSKTQVVASESKTQVVVSESDMLATEIIGSVVKNRVTGFNCDFCWRGKCIVCVEYSTFFSVADPLLFHDFSGTPGWTCCHCEKCLHAVNLSAIQSIVPLSIISNVLGEKFHVPITSENSESGKWKIVTVYSLSYIGRDAVNPAKPNTPTDDYLPKLQVLLQHVERQNEAKLCTFQDLLQVNPFCKIELIEKWFFE